MQFHDWWFDGPISIAGKSLDPPQPVVEDFVSHCYGVWRSWPTTVQQLAISMLLMHTRAPGYRWYWERFAWEYTVTDACYKIAEAVWSARLPTKRPGHAERISTMCRTFGVSFETDERDWVTYAVALRNELLHEVRYAGAQPSSHGTNAGVLAPRMPHKLNQRLIVALLGYENGFVGSGWYTFTNAPFRQRWR